VWLKPETGFRALWMPLINRGRCESLPEKPSQFSPSSRQHPFLSARGPLHLRLFGSQPRPGVGELRRCNPAPLLSSGLHLCRSSPGRKEPRQKTSSSPRQTASFSTTISRNTLRHERPHQRRGDGGRSCLAGSPIVASQLAICRQRQKLVQGLVIVHPRAVSSDVGPHPTADSQRGAGVRLCARFSRAKCRHAASLSRPLFFSTASR